MGRIHSMKSSSAYDQNHRQNPGLELKRLPGPDLNYFKIVLLFKCLAFSVFDFLSFSVSVSKTFKKMSVVLSKNVKNIVKKIK